MGIETTSVVKLLVISHCFPPDAQVGGLRVTEFCRYLPEFGVQPIVLTIDDKYRLRLDQTFSPVAGLHVERTEVEATRMDWYRRSKALLGVGGNSSQPAKVSPVTPAREGLLRRNLITLLQFPEPDSGWYRPAIRAAEKLIWEESIAGIISSSPPVVSHRIARHLKEKFNLPWLADFRDPWTAPQHRDKPAWWRRANQRMESRCVRATDRVICNTELIRQEFLRSYPDLPQQKFLTLTNGYVTFPGASLKLANAGNQILLLHVGDIYRLRRIDTFCIAVEKLLKAGKLDATKFRIVLLGTTEPKLEAAAREAAPELFGNGCVEFRNRVDRDEALRALWQADLLLLFQGGHVLQIPAKFYEYLSTGKPIFAVAQKGALTDLLEETGAGIWADSEKPDEIAAGLLRALALPSFSPGEVQQRWYERFHYRSLTARLAACFHDLAAARETHPRT